MLLGTQPYMKARLGIRHHALFNELYNLLVSYLYSYAMRFAFTKFQPASVTDDLDGLFTTQRESS